MDGGGSRALRRRGTRGGRRRERRRTRHAVVRRHVVSCSPREVPTPGRPLVRSRSAAKDARRGGNPSRRANAPPPRKSPPNQPAPLPRGVHRGVGRWILRRRAGWRRRRRRRARGGDRLEVRRGALGDGDAPPDPAAPSRASSSLAVGDADGGDAHRLAVCIDGEVVLAEIPAPPPLSLAAVLGSLSAGPAGSAAAKVFGSDVAAKMATPPTHAVDAPDFVSRVPRGSAAGAVVPVGDFFTSDATRDAEARAAAELFAGDAAVKPAAAEKALAPFLSDGAIVPPAVLAAAVDGCVRRELWEPLRALVAGGHVASSSTAPDLVRCLLAADRLADLDAFLVSARDVSPADARRCLDAFLSDGGVSPSALAAVVDVRTATAEAAVRDAEAAARGRKEKGVGGAESARARRRRRRRLASRARRRRRRGRARRLPARGASSRARRAPRGSLHRRGDSSGSLRVRGGAAGVVPRALARDVRGAAPCLPTRRRRPGLRRWRRR